MQLADPSLRLRVFKGGEGSPVVLLHTGGGFALHWLWFHLGVFAGCHAVEQLPDAVFTYSYREGKLPGSAGTFASECRWALTLRGWRSVR